ncbi:MAG: glycosyltransferase family 2 protein, partial [Candidatus Gastranaerophilales bacterium]|nr:glycosyltransferase family 2 protein [Candidatus Gastranaerophilales bacterium]
PYIQEWIEYHKLIGFSKFYIYDNDSDDNLEETLKKYINDETVVYCKFSGKCMQLAAYQHAIENYKNENRYMAIIDLDEFIVSPDEENLLNILKNMEEKKKDFGGLAINWCMYGSSGHKQKPRGGVLENYLYRACDDFVINHYVKTICNPRKVYNYESPHSPIYYRNFYDYDIDGQKRKKHSLKITGLNKLRIIHYFTKSYEEFLAKRNRGMADKLNIRSLEIFESHDRNDIKDDLMLKYTDRIKKINEDFDR